MKEQMDIEIPNEDDENVGDGAPKKKKEKRRKSKEEKQAERRVIFWTFLVVAIATLLFWLIPRIGKVNFGLPAINHSKPNIEVPKSGWKGYVEYKL